MIESFYKNSRRLWNFICNFLLSRIVWLQVVKCSNVRHFPSPSRICKCCDSCLFFRGYHHIICHPLLKREYRVCVRHIIGRGGSLLLTLAPDRGKFTYFSYIKRWMPRKTRGHGRGFKWLDWCSDPFFKSCKNDKRNSDLFFKVMRKRETKFKSVFQSNAKTKNEIHIRFSKWCESEKRNTKFKTVFQS